MKRQAGVKFNSRLVMSKVKKVKVQLVKMPRWALKARSTDKLEAIRAARLAGELFVPLVFVPSLVQGFQREAGVALTESRPRHRRHAVDKLGLEQDVGVGEHAVL